MESISRSLAADSIVLFGSHIYQPVVRNVHVRPVIGLIGNSFVAVGICNLCLFVFHLGCPCVGQASLLSCLHGLLQGNIAKMELPAFVKTDTHALGMERHYYHAIQ